MKYYKPKFPKWVIYVALAWTLGIGLSVLTAAGNSGTPPEGLTASSTSTFAWNLSETQIDVIAEPKKSTSCGSASYSAQNETLTLTSSSAAKLSVEVVTLTGNGTLKLNDVQVAQGYKNTYDLAENGTLKVYISSGGDANESTTLVLNISYAQIGQNVSANFQPIEGVSYKVNGTVVGANAQDFTADAADGFTVVADDAHYVFTGATLEEEDGTITTLTATAGKVFPKKDGEITPIFAYDQDGDGIAPFKVGTSIYWDFDSAKTAAGSSGTIILNDNYTLPANANYTIPAGVTLLLPYSADDTSIKGAYSSSADYLAHGNYAFNASGGEQKPNSNVTYQLTIPKGTTVIVADGSAATAGKCGRIVVGGKVASGNGSTLYNGATYKEHSNLVVDGTLKLGNYAVLAVTGYVLGDGDIIAEGTGAQIFQPYVVMDFPGAAVSALAMRKGGISGATQPSGEAKLSPYIYWGVVNIQTNLTMKSGNLMIAYCTLGDDGEPYHTNAVLVGNNSTQGLLTLDNDAVFYNDFEPITWSGYSYGLLGRNKIKVEGGASMGSLTLALNAGWTSVDIGTSEVSVGIGYNMAITLDKGDYFIDTSMMLLPGSELVVAKDATLSIGSKASSAIRFAVWDGLIHRGYRNSASSKGEYQFAAATTRNQSMNYPTNVELDKGGLSEDAEFVIDGTLVIGPKTAIGGVIQSNGGGRVEVNASATTSVKVQANVLDCQKFSTNYRYMASMSMFDSAAKLNLNGTLTALQVGRTYIGSANNTLTNSGFTNIYYPGFDSSGNRVDPTNLNVTYNSAETIKGVWVCEDHTNDNGDNNCDVCGAVLCAHANMETIAAVVPTCTTAGNSVYYSCSCGKYFSDAEGKIEIQKDSWVIPAGHKTTKTEAKEATCKAAGNSAYYTCSVCGKYFSDAEGKTEIQKDSWVVPVKAHTPGTATEEKHIAATCTTEGSYESVVKCTACGAEISRKTITVDALGHSYKATVKFSDDGKTYTVTVTCTVCESGTDGHTKTSESMESTSSHTEGDCVTNSFTIYTASGTFEKCEYSDSKKITGELGNHKPSKIAAKAPTCTETGNNEYWTCDVCGLFFADQACTIPTTEKAQTLSAKHTLTKVGAQAATCEGIGWNAYECCSECDYTTYVEIPALKHDYVGTVTTQPTCTAKGEKTYVCRNDASHTYTEEVAMKEHTLTQVGAKAATCTDIGWDAYERCSVCSYTTYKEIPAKNHSYGAWSVTDAPTVSKTGLLTRTCANDENHTETFVLPELNVDKGYTYLVVKDAVCEVAGEGKYSYTKDGQTFDFTVAISALSHDKQYHNAQNPTCTAIGWEAYETCSRCDYSTYVEKKALGHDEIAHSAKAATCTAIGWDAYVTCSRCDYTTYSEIGALGHDEISHDAQAATCTDIGWDAYVTCLRCDYTTYEEIGSLGHTPGTEATCTEAQICTVCDAVITAALGHSFGDWVVTTDPTCTVDGEKYHKCQNCDYSETAVAEALGHINTDTDGRCDRCQASLCVTHNYEAKVTPPSCTEAGYTTYTCSVCHESYVADAVDKTGHTPGADATCTADQTCTECGAVITAALGHDEIAHDAQSPTCTEVGWEAYVTCSRCDYSTYVEKKALGHDEIDHNAQNPTCTEIGWEAYETCSRCDYSTYVEKKALGHDEIAHSAKAATCTAIGWDAYVTCSRCDHTTYSEIGALGHDKISHDAQDATCTAIGWDAYETCSRCDYSTYSVIPSLDHNRVPHEGKAATCTESGWEAYETCTRCDYTTYKEIGALGHATVNHEGKDATCTEDGWKAYETCSRCDYTTYSKITALDHDRVSHEGKSATCTESGWEAYETCTRCDYSTYKAIGALGHDAINHEGKSATCTESGWEAYETCSRCDYSTYKVIGALGHDEIFHKAKEATCTGIGWDAYVTCSRCDYSTYVEKPQLEHTPDLPVEENRVEATCSAEGYYDLVVYCADCGTELSSTREVIKKIDHQPGEAVYENEVPATCFKEGSRDEVTYCTVCKAETSRAGKVIPKIAHVGSTTIENEVPATCYAEGSYDEVFTCGVEGCGYVRRETKIYEKREHTHGTAVPEYDEDSAPTCGKDGYYYSVVYCSVEQCGVELERSEKIVDPATGEHNYTTETVRVPATCTEDGYYTEKCGTCGHEKTTVIPQTNHRHELTETTPPTCEKDGYFTYVCSACSDVVTQIDTNNPRTGHNDSDGDDICDVCNEHICGHTWELDYEWLENNTVCIITGKASCGKSEHDKEATATVGNYTIDITHQKSATCDEAGLDKYVAYFADSWLKQAVGIEEDYIELELEVETPATNHAGTLVQVESKAPTCTDIGYGAYEYCTACDHTTYVEIPSLGHKYEAVKTDPTCSAQGYTTHTCSVCSDSYVDSYVDATGVHVYSEQRIYDERESWKECTRCGEKYDVVTRTYNVTIVDYWGNETVRRGYTYGQYLWLNYSTSNVLELQYNGWKLQGEDGEMKTVPAYEVWENFAIDETTENLIVYEDTTAVKVKYGAIMMSVNYDEANSEKTMTVDLFIYVDSLDKKPDVYLGDQKLDLQEIDPSIMMYFVSIDLSAEQITQGGANVKIKVDFDRDGTPDKEIDSVLIAYQEALKGYLNENAGDHAGEAQEEAITAMLNYGKTVQVYFENADPSDWDFKGYTDIAKYANSTAPSQKSNADGTFTWMGANVRFDEEYSMRYDFALPKLAEGITPEVATLIVKDAFGNEIGKYTVDVIPKAESSDLYSVLYPVPASDLAKAGTTVQLYIDLSEGAQIISPEYEYGIYAHLTYSVYLYTDGRDADGNPYYVKGDDPTTRVKTKQYVEMLVSLLKLGEAVQSIEAMTPNQQ